MDPENHGLRNMRQFLFLFVVMAAVGMGFARYSDHAKTGGSNAMAMAAKPAPAPAPAVSSNYRTVTLNSDRRGHFQTDVRVDGRNIDFMVDTGASSIALRESSAAKLGIHPSARDYNIKMQTANGVGKAARVKLNRVELGGITVRDVDALVVPDESLSVNLLGMTFLSRVKWSHDRGRLVLEQ
jgi:aspartyl protease family protein